MMAIEFKEKHGALMVIKEDCSVSCIEIIDDGIILLNGSMEIVDVEQILTKIKELSDEKQNNNNV